MNDVTFLNSKAFFDFFGLFWCTFIIDVYKLLMHEKIDLGLVFIQHTKIYTFGFSKNNFSLLHIL